MSSPELAPYPVVEPIPRAEPPVPDDGSGTVVDAEVKVPAEDIDVVPEASDSFVLMPYVESLTARALTYLDVGYALHFAGPAGTGKTTLALHVASKRGRPVVLIHGDDEYASSDLVGRDSGYHKSKLVDNYIYSVVKTEESLSRIWEDQRLTTACIKGYTLIYDEFNRSRPEANNVLLSVLEGKIPRRNEREVMNLACLVKREAVPQFEAAVFEFAKQFDNNFALDYNGPWAPHNFVNVDLEL